jgi:hypothetical protein
MIQVDIPAAYICSQVFAYSGRKWLCDVKPEWTGKYSLLSTVFALVIVGSAGLYLWEGWTEWEIMYWFESLRMNTDNYGNPYFALVGPLFVASCGVVGLISFMLAHRWIRENRIKTLLTSLWISIAVMLSFFVIFPSAPMLVGHYHDYHAFLKEAMASADKWEYGIFNIGAWKLCVPWAVAKEHLVKHNLITYFNPKFFIPVALDLSFFFVCMIASVRWFKKHRPAQSV